MAAHTVVISGLRNWLVAESVPSRRDEMVTTVLALDSGKRVVKQGFTLQAQHRPA